MSEEHKRATGRNFLQATLKANLLGAQEETSPFADKSIGDRVIATVVAVVKDMSVMASTVPDEQLRREIMEAAGRHYAEVQLAKAKIDSQQEILERIGRQALGGG